MAEVRRMAWPRWRRAARRGKLAARAGGEVGRSAGQGAAPLRLRRAHHYRISPWEGGGSPLPPDLTVEEGREPAATGSRHGRGGGSPPPPDLTLGEGRELAAAGSRRGSAAGGGTAGCSVRGRRRGRASPWEEEGPPYAAAAGGEGARVLLLRPRKGTERRRKTTERGRKFAYRVASDAKCIP